MDSLKGNQIWDGLFRARSMSHPLPIAHQQVQFVFYNSDTRFFPPTAENFGVSAQIGSGVVRGGPDVRFHEGSTRVPPGFHEGSTLRGGASTKKSTACCWGYHPSFFLVLYFRKPPHSLAIGIKLPSFGGDRCRPAPPLPETRRAPPAGALEELRLQAAPWARTHLAASRACPGQAGQAPQVTCWVDKDMGS